MADKKKKKQTPKKAVSKKTTAKKTPKATAAKKKQIAAPKKAASKKPVEKAKKQTKAATPSRGVEVVGFNEALKRHEAMQLVKKINREALNKRVKELTNVGVPKEVAKVMAQVEREYNLK